MADINVGAIVATTLRKHRRELADNVTQHNALLKRIEERGNLKESVSGGRTIFEPLIHGTNSSVKFYDGYETFTPPTDIQETVDGAEFNWKQLGGFLAISGKEMAMNSGAARIIDLAEARMKQLKAQMRNTAAVSVYSNGTGTAGKEFGGLQLLIADAPSGAGTVGGIDQAANAFWRNQVTPAVVGTPLTSATIKPAMSSMWLRTIRGTDKPDLILADSVMFSLYETSLQDQARFTDPKRADAGFVELAYKTAAVTYDDNCPAKHMYFVNTESISFRYSAGRFFSVGDSREIQNADYTVTPVWVMGNLTINNRGLNGVIITA